MVNSSTTLSLIVLTVAAAAASAIAWRRLLGRDASDPLAPVQQGLMTFIIGVSAALFVYRWLVVRGQWQPLDSHVDGLLLIAVILAPTTLFLQSRTRLPGLGAFALPPLTVLLAWAICASYWTFHDFRMSSFWVALHTVGVYAGTACLGVAAIAGGMFLFAQSRLHRNVDLAAPRLASLERIERAIIISTGMGFGLLTFGLVTGLIVVSSGPTALGVGWWHSPKIILAASVWTIYAIVMNVRHGSIFRGYRAAWLSIIGLALLLTTFAIVNALPAHNSPPLPATSEMEEVP